jgi:hypothetical protein
MVPEDGEDDHSPTWLWWQDFAQHVGHELDELDLLARKGSLNVWLDALPTLHHGSYHIGDAETEMRKAKTSYFLVTRLSFFVALLIQNEAML